MKKYGKFAALIAVVVGTLVWLAVTGGKQSKTYYKTITEAETDGRTGLSGSGCAWGATWRTGPSSASATRCSSCWSRTNTSMKVVYTGTDPLPDTLQGRRAGAGGRQAGPGQVFRAGTVQAKCASKYESKPGTGARAGRSQHQYG